jgi:probable O-glycosylation ligase (exosortase A-associated)
LPEWALKTRSGWGEASTTDKAVSLAFLGILVYLVDEYLRLSQCYPAFGYVMFGKVVVGVTLLAMLFGQEMHERVSSPLNRVVVAFAAAMLVSYPASQSTDAATLILSDYLKVLVGYFLIVKTVNTRWRLTAFMLLLLFVNLKMSQFQIRNYSMGMGVDPHWTGIRGYGAGSTGLFGNAGDFGVAMCTVLPVALAMFLGLKGSKWRWLALLATVSFFLSVLCSSSRGAALGLAAVGLYYWLRSRRKAVGVVVLVVAAMVFWGLAPDSYKERFSTTNTEEDYTSEHRLDLWAAGVQMFLANPLTGVGIGNFPVVYRTRFRPDISIYEAVAPHNIFVQAGSELGLPGLLCLLSGIVLIFVVNGRTRQLVAVAALPDADFYRHLSRGLEAALVGFVVSGFFLTVLYYPHFYTVCALTVILNHVAEKRLAEAGHPAVLSEWRRAGLRPAMAATRTEAAGL